MSISIDFNKEKKKKMEVREMNKTLNKTLNLNRVELSQRMELIPAKTQELVKKALADFQSVDKDTLEKIRTDMTGAKYLLIRENVPRFTKGFKNFNLAVACGRFICYPYIAYKLRYKQFGSAEEFYEKLLEIMDQLHISEKNKETLLYRYGFSDGVYHTLEDTGKKVGVQKSAILRRINKAACEIAKYL